MAADDLAFVAELTDLEINAVAEEVAGALAGQPKRNALIDRVLDVLTVGPVDERRTLIAQIVATRSEAER